MTAGVVAFLLLALLAVLAWLGRDRGPNPRETFDPSTRQRIDAMRDAEGEAREGWL